MKEVAKLIETLHPLERQVLPFLKEGVTLQAIVAQSGMQEVEVIRAFQWLGNKNVVKIKKDAKKTISLGANGKKYLEQGLPERRFLQVLEYEPLSLSEIQEKADLDKNELNISLGLLKRLGAITLGKKIDITSVGKKFITQKLLEETFLKLLPRDTGDFDKTDERIFEALQKRRDIIEVKVEKSMTVHLTELGRTLLTSDIKTDLIDALHRQLITSKDWEKKKFRRYDVEINVPKLYGGRRHFVNQAIDYIKRIWLELGFKEMEGPLVDTAFWNFDALFVPQDHPAREMQDTFFAQGKGKLPNKELVGRVKRTHETGWTTNSKGWQYKWSEQKAKELLLRTHTTVLSARTLATLKQSDLPCKYFSVAKCFRNETIDWKHSFEFNQVEGIVVDEDANFRHLLGYLKEYYAKLGFHKIRFRPAYFPYTEMSVESEYYHPQKKEWVEFGGAGIFRPEVTKPLLGHDIPVLAWGQGMERAIMDYYNIKDLRDLCSNDLQQLKEIKMWMQ